MKKITMYVVLIGIAFQLPSCKKENNTAYEIPATYNFSGVDYHEQKYLLDMLTALTDEMKKANTAGFSVDAQLLKNMYANVNHPFANDTLNNAGVSLREKTFAPIQMNTESYLDAHAVSSQSLVEGKQGTAGVIRSGILTYLSSAEGIEHTQLVGIGLQGAALYYQLTSICLDDAKIGAQVPLEERQHNWDVAFGYFGVPKDFPTVPASGKWLGKYSNLRDPLICTNTVLMNAFIKGRAAINHEDDATVAEQAAVIRDNLEKVMAAGVIHYCNESLSNATDNAVRNHSLSEGISWTRALRYNPTKKISDAQILQVEGYFGNNFYTLSTANIQAAKNLISTVYSFNSTQKEQL